MTYYYALEYSKPLNGHYIYLDDVLEDVDTKEVKSYTTTDNPSQAMQWADEDEADRFLETLPFKSDFHVQRMCIGD